MAAIPCFAYKRGLEKKEQQANSEDSCPAAKKSKMDEKNEEENQEVNENSVKMEIEEKNTEENAENSSSVDVTVRVHSADEYNKTLSL